MLAQRLEHSGSTGDMRILFTEGMKARLVERNGWLILKEGNAWLGVKGFSREVNNKSCGYSWDDDYHLRMNDGDAPVALIAARSAKADETIDAFAAYLNKHTARLSGGWFTLSIRGGREGSLSLDLTQKRLPRVDGQPVDLNPEKVFDSPFMSADHASGVVIIRKGERVLTIDMNE